MELLFTSPLQMATQSASAEGSGKKKPPSRRTRRRPLDLAKEYMKREDKCTWLETHIWHAKRMKMAAKWGFKLAVKRADKGIRAAYHSMKSECLLSVSGSLSVAVYVHTCAHAYTHITHTWKLLTL